MNEIKIFEKSDFGQMRTVATESNQVMFCLSDVCNALEIGNSSDVAKRLNPKGVDTIDTLTKGGVQKLTYIDEPNLYKCIFQSRKENAVQFQDWVCYEILPSIRKNGGYIMNQEELTNEELLAQALTVANKVLVERDKRIAQMNNTIAMQAEIIKEQEPKVKLMNQFMAAKNNRMIGDFAKILSNEQFIIGQNGLFGYLRYKHIIYKVGRYNKANQDYINKGWLKATPKTYEVEKTGEIVGYDIITLTPKGQAELALMIFNDRSILEFVSKKNRNKVEKFFD